VDSRGFTVVEILVGIAVAGIVLALSMINYPSFFRIHEREREIQETEEALFLPLLLLRDDIASAGFGLPFSFQSSILYPEAQNHPYSEMNSEGVPKALDSGPEDWLVIRTARGPSWGTVKRGEAVRSLDPLKLKNGQRVIVVDPVTMELVVPGPYYAVYQDGLPSGFLPLDETYVIYGIVDTDLKAPFNRIDYRLTDGAGTECAPGTRRLVRAYLDHGTGNMVEEEILPCVLSLEVSFLCDMDGDGRPETWLKDISSFSPEDVRRKVRAVSVYLLFHEGTYDPSFSFSRRIVKLREREIDLERVCGDKWRNFRWKVRGITERARNLDLSF
jgi:prepilin-type N-terminal cleavage/methylation domain-containing protein